jgi:hypothetical protein
LFYLTRPLEDGIPHRNCLTFLKNAIGNNLIFLGIISIIAGSVTFITFFLQYCLWKKYDELSVSSKDEENQPNRFPHVVEPRTPIVSPSIFGGGSGGEITVGNTVNF